MPELPEVESVARSLRRRVLGLRIAAVEAIPPKGKAGRGPATGWGGGREARAARALPLSTLVGRTIDKVGRRGKNLILECGDAALLFHLKMTGRFLWSRPGRPRGKHVHLVLSFKRPARELHFEDVRKFGLVRCRPLDGLSSCPELGLSVPSLSMSAPTSSPRGSRPAAAGRKASSWTSPSWPASETSMPTRRSSPPASTPWLRRRPCPAPARTGCGRSFSTSWRGPSRRAALRSAITATRTASSARSRTSTASTAGTASPARAAAARSAGPSSAAAAATSAPAARSGEPGRPFGRSSPESGQEPLLSPGIHL